MAQEGAQRTEGRQCPWALFKNAVSLSWSHVPLSVDLLCSVQPMRTRSLLIFFFSLEGLGSRWMSQTHHPRLLLWTPMNMTLCWSFFATHILPHSWRHEEETCNKDRVYRLEHHPNRHHFFLILRPACLTAVLGSCSSSHSASTRRCTRRRSLQLVGTSRTLGVSFAAREYLLLDGSKAW